MNENRLIMDLLLELSKYILLDDKENNFQRNCVFRAMRAIEDYQEQDREKYRIPTKRKDIGKEV